MRWFTYKWAYLLCACIPGLMISAPHDLRAQGLSHTFLLGYLQSVIDTHTSSPKARLLFDSNNVILIPESRKMSFRATQATISDSSGNLIIATNGCWIANATGDTMMNGAFITPQGPFYSNWCDPLAGVPFSHAAVLLPYPESDSLYILLHQTGNYAVGGNATEVYYSVIDMTLDGGLGAVIQKNVVLQTDTFAPCLAANRHANGRDWWIIALKENSDLVFKFLLTPAGISMHSTQSLGVPPAYINVTQPTFSPDGNKFSYSFTIVNSGVPYNDVRLFDFDRCSGMFSNPLVIDLSDGYIGLGLAFSASSKYLYATSDQMIYQINTDTTDVLASVQLVAINDGYYSPHPPFQTDFWLMYLAANGKIYITSGNGVIDLHYINYPDSAGMACDVQQHALHLPCWSGRGNVYHPNYYLGCDTTLGCPCLTVGMDEATGHDFKFSVSPNPSHGSVKIIYLLPQNKVGRLEVFDINGRRVYEMNLPPWSTLQQLDLSFLKGGVYQCVISSGGWRAARKLVVMNQP